MTIHEANEMYKVAIEGTSGSYQIIIYGVMVVVLVVSIIAHCIKNNKLKTWLKKWFMPTIITVTVSSGILLVYSINQDNEKIKKKIAEWEDKVEKETINVLPVKKIELEDYLITKDKEIKDGRKYILNKRKNPKIIEIIYLENGMKTRDTIEANIKKVKGLETPYIETQSLESNIPKDPDNIVYKKGFYNTVLYIPE